MDNIIEHEGIRFKAASDLEQWRVKTLLTKEPETIKWIDSQAALGGVFYDVGANIGIYSLYAKKANPDLSVFAFEPVSNNYNALFENILINDHTELHTFNVAISDKNLLVSLFLKDARVGNSGGQIDSPHDEKGNEFLSVREEKVMCFSLDSLVSDYGFPVPAFLKIDVDGQESKIIKGMEAVLKNPGFRSILVEFNSNDEERIFTNYFTNFGLTPDKKYNELECHSKFRREEKGSSARNIVFSRISGA